MTDWITHTKKRTNERNKRQAKESRNEQNTVIGALLMLTVYGGRKVGYVRLILAKRIFIILLHIQQPLMFVSK